VAGLACADVRQLSDLAAAKAGRCGTEITAALACEPSKPAPFIYFQF